MQYLALTPYLIVATGAGFSRAGLLPAMIGWIVCALGVVAGLAIAISMFFVSPSDSWMFTLVATMPAILAIPKVVIDLRHPRINDVTTNIADPPEFVTALDRSANANRDMQYPKKFESLMRHGYPNIQPLVLDESPKQVFQRVKTLAKAQPGWVVTHCDAQSRFLEGEVRTSVLQFVDDFVIRVSDQEGKTNVDMRSKSRDGLLDAGVNAKRIQSFFAQLEKATSPSGSTAP